MEEIERYEIEGDPTPQEAAAIVEALEATLRAERAARAPSAWVMAGRAMAMRSGILDVRDRLGRFPWAVSQRLPWAGRVHAGRHGRGDSR